jgi:gas vesicle protein
MDNNGKVAAAFLLGIIIGGAAGILFAPKSGKETREHVHRYMKNTEEKLCRKKDEFMKKADDLKKRFGKALHSDETDSEAEKS